MKAIKWKKQHSNIIVVTLLSIAYVIVTLLVVIGPLHVNSSGDMNQLSGKALYAIMYMVIALGLNWYLFAVFRKKPEFLFFTLILVGIAVIITEIFLFA